jgi:hypothetical protein
VTAAEARPHPAIHEANLILDRLAVLSRSYGTALERVGSTAIVIGDPD